MISGSQKRSKWDDVIRYRCLTKSYPFKCKGNDPNNAFLCMLQKLQFRVKKYSPNLDKNTF